MDEQAAPDASSTHAHQYDATALPLGMRVLAGGINTYLRAIALSSRHVVENVAPVQELQLDGKPVIILLWHERTFQVPSITSFCPRPLYALTSRSRDGAIIGNVMRKFGMLNIQGSGTGAAANKQQTRASAARKPIAPCCRCCAAAKPSSQQQTCRRARRARQAPA